MQVVVGTHGPQCQPAWGHWFPRGSPDEQTPCPCRLGRHRVLAGLALRPCEPTLGPTSLPAGPQRCRPGVCVVCFMWCLVCECVGVWVWECVLAVFINAPAGGHVRCPWLNARSGNGSLHGPHLPLPPQPHLNTLMHAHTLTCTLTLKHAITHMHSLSHKHTLTGALDPTQALVQGTRVPVTPRRSLRYAPGHTCCPLRGRRSRPRGSLPPLLADSV